MQSWLITPDIPPDRWWWFAGTLIPLLLLELLLSPRRRAAMGLFRFTAALTLNLAVPLSAVILVRSGVRHALIEADRGWWTALWLSLFWMLAFLFAARFLVRRLPPFSGLLRQLDAVGADIWRQRLKRWSSFLFPTRNNAP